MWHSSTSESVQHWKAAYEGVDSAVVAEVVSRLAEAQQRIRAALRHLQPVVEEATAVRGSRRQDGVVVEQPGVPAPSLNGLFGGVLPHVAPRPALLLVLQAARRVLHRRKAVATPEVLARARRSRNFNCASVARETLSAVTREPVLPSRALAAIFTRVRMASVDITCVSRVALFTRAAGPVAGSLTNPTMIARIRKATVDFTRLARIASQA